LRKSKGNLGVYYNPSWLKKRNGSPEKKRWIGFGERGRGIGKKKGHLGGGLAIFLRRTKVKVPE